MLNNWNTKSLQKALREVKARLNDITRPCTYKDSLTAFGDSLQDEIEYRIVWESK